MIIRKIKNHEKELFCQMIHQYFGSYDYYNLDYINTPGAIHLAAVDEDGTIAGLIDAYPTDDFFSYPEGYEICDVIVKEHYRRTGLSLRLFQEILALLPKKSPVYLCAWGTYRNGACVTHLEKTLKEAGFTFSGRIPDYYKNHGDCPECVNHSKENCSCYMDIYIRPEN